MRFCDKLRPCPNPKSKTPKNRNRRIPSLILQSGNMTNPRTHPHPLQRRAADPVEKADQAELVQTPDHQDCQNGWQVITGLCSAATGVLVAFGAWLKLKLRPPADPRIQRMERELEELRHERERGHVLESVKDWFREEALPSLRQEFGGRRRP